MKSREKVLIWGMMLAVAWAAYAMLAGALRQRTLARKPDAQLTSLQDFASLTRLAVAATQVRPNERQVLERAREGWSANPFAGRAEASAPLPPPQRAFRYTGFFQLGAHRFAIVNGREYGARDPVDPGDFVVESIEPDRVTLAAVSGGRRLTIGLESLPGTRSGP